MQTARITPASSNQFRGERAIESVPKRKQDTCSASFRKRNSSHDGLDDFLILFRFDAARAVDQDAARFEQRNCRAENSRVAPRGIRDEIVWRQSPAHVHAAAHHTGVAARRSTRMRSKERSPRPPAAVRRWSSRAARIGAIPTPSRSRFSCSVPIRPSSRSQATMAPWFFINSARYRGFPAGRGAGVEHVFARLGIEQHAGGGGARVLDVAIARGRAPRSGTLVRRDEIFRPPASVRRPGCADEKFLVRNLEPIDPRVNRGRPVVPLAKSRGVLGAEVCASSVRSEIAGCEVRTLRSWLLAFSQRVPLFAQGVSQNGVDQAIESRGRRARPFRKRPRVPASGEERVDRGRAATGRARRDPDARNAAMPIQKSSRRQVAQDAVEKFGGEGAIRRRRDRWSAGAARGSRRQIVRPCAIRCERRRARELEPTEAP